jgi:RimJ/RimL family protein N-acetyltransferase
MVEIIRLSGYRLNGLPVEQANYRWAALRGEVAKYLHYFADIPPGFYLDDAQINEPLIDLMMGRLVGGEIYLVFSRQQFVGMCALTGIQFGRKAYIEAIAHPNYIGSHIVGKAMGEILTYAFKDFGDNGLGLKKIKAIVAHANGRVANMLLKVGFKVVGTLVGEALHGGVPHDMILLEFLNPKFFSVDKQVINNVERTIITELQPDRLCESGGAPAGPVSDGQYTESADGGTDSAGREPDDGERTGLAEPEQLQWHKQPVGAWRHGGSIQSTADESDVELVHAKRSYARGIGSAIADAAGWSKLRKLWGGRSRTDVGAGTAISLHGSPGS